MTGVVRLRKIQVGDFQVRTLFLSNGDTEELDIDVSKEEAGWVQYLFPHLSISIMDPSRLLARVQLANGADPIADRDVEQLKRL